jgi:hypothetical protein
VKTSKRGKAMRGSVVGPPGNTGPDETDFLIAHFLGAALSGPRFRFADCEGLAENGMKDRDIVRCSPLSGRETLCKLKLKGVARMK